MSYVDNKELFSLHRYEYLNTHKEISTSYTITVRKGNEGEEQELYNTFSKPRAELAFSKLKDMYDIHIKYWLRNERIPVMFEIDKQIYKTEYVFPKQSCICGSQIPGNDRYGIYTPDTTKFDYAQETIFFYDENEALVIGNQLFLNGELLFNSTDLFNLCNSIGQDFNKLDLYPNKIIDYLVSNYNVCTYICDGYSSYNLKNKEE